MTAEYVAAVCWSALCWIAGVGYGRWRLVTWERRVRRSVERLVAAEAKRTGVSVDG